MIALNALAHHAVPMGSCHYRIVYEEDTGSFVYKSKKEVEANVGESRTPVII